MGQFVPLSVRSLTRAVKQDHGTPQSAIAQATGLTLEEIDEL
jgi:hypothetical protein